MCGVAAIYAYHHTAAPVDREELRRMRDDMASRGPDGQGEWYAGDGRLGLGHRRLAIIDLSGRGAQPMTTADGSLTISFNGEIYNYQSLRRTLEAAGYAFRSDSDTEVLLHLYAWRGEAMFAALRGMFAFALWDARQRRLLLARDPYGIKPLYYANDGRTVRVASQVKALLAGGRISRELDPAGVAGFWLFGSVPEPFTLYQSIQAVPAGSFVWVDADGPQPPRSCFSLAETFRAADQRPEPLTVTDLSAAVRAALLDSVRHHLVADVPVGAFLSAGIDSGSLVGLMRDAGQQDLQTITLAFAEFLGQSRDEAPLAEQVARHYGTRHTTRRITEQEFREDLPRLLAAMDQPSIDGVNTWFVSKAARELGLKVAVSGLGGDELFGGYPSFREIPRWVRLLALPARIPGLGDLFQRIFSAHGRQPAAGSRLPAAHLSPKFAGLLKYGGTYPGAYLLRRGLFMPWELDALMAPEQARQGLARLQPLQAIAAALTPPPRTAFSRVAALEAGFYMRNQLLRDTDWASMAHALEVRTPLVDVALLSRLAPALAAQRRLDGKALLAGSPANPLPLPVTARPKTGFETPVATWLERVAEAQTWRRSPLLNRPDCHWARRWAYTVFRHFTDSQA